MSLGARIWSVLLQHGFFKRRPEQKLVCAKDSGEIALRPNFDGIHSWPRLNAAKRRRGRRLVPAYSAVAE
jgi:hypothetical protein